MKKKVDYGSLSTDEQSSPGWTFLPGISSTGWHSTRSFGIPTLDDLKSWLQSGGQIMPTVTDAVGFKVKYSGGWDVEPTDQWGSHYFVNGGYQQNTTNGATETKFVSSWMVHFSLHDDAGNFEGDYLKIDLDPGSGTNFLTFMFDNAANAFTALDQYGNLRTIAVVGSEDGTVIQGTIDMYKLRDLMLVEYNRPYPGTGPGGQHIWSSDHGNLDFVIGHVNTDQFQPIIETWLNVEVGRRLPYVGPGITDYGSTSPADYGAWV